jgi:hypothetical protein
MEHRQKFIHCSSLWLNSLVNNLHDGQLYMVALSMNAQGSWDLWGQIPWTWGGPVSLSILHLLIPSWFLLQSLHVWGLCYQNVSPTNSKPVPSHWVAPSPRTTLSPALKVRLLLLLEEIKMWSIKAGNPTEPIPRASKMSKAACLLRPLLWQQAN